MITKEPIYEESKRGILEKAGLYDVIGKYKVELLLDSNNLYLEGG